MCIYQCKPPFGWRGVPCEECKADYAQHVDDLIAVHKLQKADVAARKSEASDQQWEDHLGPVEATTRLDNCPLCDQSDYPSTWSGGRTLILAEGPEGKVWIYCPWCQGTGIYPVPEAIRINDQLIVESE